jgi:hypothetical protein
VSFLRSFRRSFKNAAISGGALGNDVVGSTSRGAAYDLSCLVRRLTRHKSASGKIQKTRNERICRQLTSPVSVADWCGQGQTLTGYTVPLSFDVLFVGRQTQGTVLHTKSTSQSSSVDHNTTSVLVGSSVFSQRFTKGFPFCWGASSQTNGKSEARRNKDRGTP